MQDTRYKMKIGIDASRAFMKERTGIEEYSYQVIENLMNELKDHQVVLYTRSGQSAADCPLPGNWKVKVINWPYLWTQIRLSLEMLFHPVDALFIPSHVVPIIHPKNTIVTVHGLEFEIFPEGYSYFARLYMRWSIRMSCRWAKKIIAVSENTKRDLVSLYKVPKEKIEVIYEGVNIFPFGKGGIKGGFEEQKKPNKSLSSSPFAKGREPERPYLLFIGRLEKRKNIEGIIESYKILKEKYNIPHKLVLAGKPGYRFSDIENKIKQFNVGAIRELLKRRAVHEPPLQSGDIIFPGFVSEKEKFELLKSADVFLFPTFYEGFGLPILEAQNMGVPVVTSNVSSSPEVGGDSVVYCDPKNPKSIAEAAYKIISNSELRNKLIKKGHENTKRFSWEKCVSQIAEILKGK